ncbi:hypothetical protein [Bacillus sp. T33-2]|uniref:hypothetical protein n=1 Tax=Bacillus sp. T33-2 TaxID=2054168 RepID=UPI0015E0942F|nr:hypothetical protein [Bacillus sp. T33-2]
MEEINHFLSHIKNNYVLIAAAAVLFFLAKAITGYITYRHYDKRFKKIDKKLDELLRR